MEDTKPPSRPRGLTIAHAASLVDEDASAFLHAVAIAQRSGSRLVSVHAGEGADARERIPRASDALSRWGLLGADAASGDEAKLGMTHERVLEAASERPTEALVAYLRRRAPDLLVATSERRTGLARLFGGTVAEAVARGVGTPTLLFPSDCRGFVDAETGKVSLGRIVVPVGDAKSAVTATSRALWFADLLGVSMLDIELVHAGEVEGLDDLKLEHRAGLRWHEQAPTGAVDDAIVAAAESTSTDLIVMATRGHDSLGDVITGSHTERVLRRAPCPLLAVPLA